jgi:hypothetical protein
MYISFCLDKVSPPVKTSRMHDARQASAQVGWPGIHAWNTKNSGTASWTVS